MKIPLNSMNCMKFSGFVAGLSNSRGDQIFIKNQPIAKPLACPDKLGVRFNHQATWVAWRSGEPGR
jgi:hypothetical protein